jgi:hypothetical protein
MSVIDKIGEGGMKKFQEVLNGMMIAAESGKQNVEKEKFYNNFANIVRAQIDVENMVKDKDFESIEKLPDESDEDLAKRVEDIVKITGEGIVSFWEAFVSENPKDRVVTERMLTTPRHLKDMNKILEKGALIVANPRGMPEQKEKDAAEMDALFKRKSRDFGMGRLQIFFTAMGLGYAMQYVIPAMGAVLTGAGVAKAGTTVGGFFTSFGAGIKSGAIWMAGHPLTTGLSMAVGGLGGWAIIRELHPRLKEWQKSKQPEWDKAAGELAAKKAATALEQELNKINLASNAFNGVMREYADKIQSRGYTNATVNAVLGGSSTLREARKILGDKVSVAFDTVVPRLPNPYELLVKWDTKEAYKFVSVPYQAGAAAVAGAAALGGMAYNAMKGGVKTGDVSKNLVDLRNRINETLKPLGDACNEAGRIALSAMNRQWDSLQKWINTPGEKNPSVFTRWSQDIGAAWSQFSKDFQAGKYSVNMPKLSPEQSAKLNANLKVAQDSITTGFTRLGAGMGFVAKGGVYVVSSAAGSVKEGAGYVAGMAATAAASAGKAMDKKPVFVSSKDAKAVEAFAKEVQASRKQQEELVKQSMAKTVTTAATVHDAVNKFKKRVPKGAVVDPAVDSPMHTSPKKSG